MDTVAGGGDCRFGLVSTERDLLLSTLLCVGELVKGLSNSLGCFLEGFGQAHKNWFPCSGHGAEFFRRHL